MRPDHHDHHVWPCFVVVEGKSSDATTQPQAHCFKTSQKYVRNLKLQWLCTLQKSEFSSSKMLQNVLFFMYTDFLIHKI